MLFDWTQNERVYLAASALALLAALARLARLDRTLGTRIVCLALLGFFALHMFAVVAGWDGTTYRDFRCFWEAGRNLDQGLDPYKQSFDQPPGQESGPFLNPPTALPLFALLGLTPLTTAYAWWTAANVLMAAALVPLARRALRAEESPAARGLDGSTVLALATAICLSNANRANVINGQLGCLAAVALIAVCAAVARKRPAAAAAAMTLATLKAGTALPFLALFLRPRVRTAFLWLAAFVAGLCLLTASPARQLGRLQLIASAITKYSAEGQMNDYSRAGPHPADILGFDRIYYHLGIGDRQTIRIAQLATLAVIGAGLVVVTLRPGTPRGLAASLLATYSVLFLYHRTYDSLILSLPLCYAVGHARTTTGRSRWLLTAAAVTILLTLYMPRKLLFNLMHQTFDSPPVRAVVEYVILPLPSWLIVASMALLWVGSRRLPSAPRSE